MPNSETPILKTALHSLHIELGARMVPFAGYDMPVQYPSGIKTEHLHCRASAGLFDVSHMGQVLVEGPGVVEELEKLIPVDLEALKLNQQSYGVFTNESGGILDDLIITRWGDECFFLVVNAGCKKQDIAHLRAHLSDVINISLLESQALIALQGPTAKDVMAGLFPNELSPEAASLTFMHGCHAEIDGASVFISRCGYTGEDGFELSVSNDAAPDLASKLLSTEGVAPIGLGARDSLRLEAGLCLYGHDMDSNVSPIEAGLSWSISQSRRTGGSKEGQFLGADVILNQMKNAPNKKRVGLDIEGRAPVREGAIIEDMEGNEIGLVTSGGFGPSVECPVAMGYVLSKYATIGTEINAIVRDKARPAKVRKTPFVPANYFRG